MLSTANTAPGLKSALVGGVAAGFLDYAAACVNSGKGPIFIGKVIATGWLGRTAMKGGLGAAVLGAVSHFAILLVVAGIYVAASRRMDFLYRQPLLCGAVLGVIVYSIMNAVVTPFSNTPAGHPDNARRLIQIGIHIAFVGLPIALATWKVR